jgi:hypothetical protein
MPARSRNNRRAEPSFPTFWVLVALGAVVLLVGLGIGIYILSRGSELPAVSGAARAVIDPNDAENTAAWAAAAVGRIKDAGDKADAEAARVEKELKDALLGKQVRWTFPGEAVDDGEVKLDSFFGTAAGKYAGDDPQLRGKPLRQLHLRVFFADGDSAVQVGKDVSALEAAGLRQGSKCAVVRTVTEITVDRHDPWVSASPYTGVVDVMEPYCVTIIVARK